VLFTSFYQILNEIVSEEKKKKKVPFIIILIMNSIGYSPLRNVKAN
jgi:hypothetical protein